MTLVVATALGDTPDELYARAREGARHADWVEVRLDGPSGLPWDLRPFFLLDKPALATVRHADDGGRSHADDATRADLLRRALRAGAKAIDVELHHAQRDSLIEEARAAGARVVLSVHDLAGTPSADDLVALLREGRRAGADWCKVATRLDQPSDAHTLVSAALRARREGIPYALMAVNDPFLRLLAPALGMALAYGAVPGRPAAAPGQVATDLLADAHGRWRALTHRVRPTTRVAYILGHPVTRVRSPAMQNAAFAAMRVDAVYVALDTPPAALPHVLAMLRHTNALGANVTMPHKVAVLDLVDEVAPTAAAAGAANTLVVDGQRLVAHNTDGMGALDALVERGFHPAGQKALVVGAGGAARGIAAALLEAGLHVRVANRTDARAVELAGTMRVQAVPWDKLASAVGEVDLVVNATSVGAADDATPFDAADLRPGAFLLDAVARPGGTRLARDAQGRGAVVVPGEAMLLHQGARAFMLWLGGLPAPTGAMRRALEEDP